MKNNGKSGIWGRVETITLVKLQKIADENKENFRKLDINRANAYADDLNAGRWEVNGETIVFGRDGKLQNGQHRIAAGLIAKKPITTFVVYNVDSNLFDRGKLRSLTDYVRPYSSNAQILSSMLTMVSRQQNGDSGDTGGKRKIVSVGSELELLAKNPELRAYADLAKKLPFQRPVLGYLWWLFSKKYPEETKKFFEEFIADDGLGKFSPVKQLRDKLRYRTKGMRYTQDIVLRYGCSALNAYIAGEELTRFYPAKEIAVNPFREKQRSFGGLYDGDEETA